jgi:hypothetical protein
VGHKPVVCGGQGPVSYARPVIWHIIVEKIFVLVVAAEGDLLCCD